METNVCSKTWMVESILVTLFCCLPLGIVGIINASKVSSLFAAGNYEAAQKASAEAAKWTKISLIVGAVVIVLYMIIYGFALGSLMNQ
ncbi:MAG: CD225/dispanin family protein [Bacteroides sp.]|nr:CD225/dispanin family protein [Bacteroides sp.]